MKTIREVKQINGYRTYSEYNRAKGLNKGTRKIQMVEIIIKGKRVGYVDLFELFGF